MPAGLLTLLVLSVGTAPAAAQGDPVPADSVALPAPEPEAETTAPVTLDTVIVTAQRREQNQQDVPISMAVLTATQLSDRNVLAIEDIAGQVAGLEFGEFAASGQISIRGVGFNLFSGIGENSTALHVDGLYLPRPSASTLLYEDLAGIEVLRGPQGTLYGRNATAGVINLVSTPPPYATTGAVGTLRGAFDRHRVKVAGSTALAEGTARLWASAIRDQRGDVFMNTRFPGRDQGANDRRSFRFNADLDLGPALRAELRSFLVDEAANGYHIEAYKPPPDSTLAPPGSYTDDPYTHANNDNGFTRKELTGGSLRLVYDFGEQWSLTTLTGYSRFVFDSDLADADGTSNDLFTSDRLNHDRTVSQELLLAFNGDRLHVTSGLYYLQESFDPTTDALVDAAALAAATAGGSVASPNQLRLNHAAHEDTASFAAFGDATYAVLDQLQLFGGLRYIDERKDQLLTVRRVVDGTDQGETDCENQANRLHERPLTGRLGTQYDPLPEVMLYAQYARGFKAGGFAVAACDNSYSPEVLDAVELGFKSTVLAHGLRASGAVFHYDYANLQVEEVNLPDVFVNDAQARVDGAELEFQFAPTAAWTLSANAGWLDAVYTRYANNDNAASPQGASPAAETQDLSGNRLNRAPRQTAGAAVDYVSVLAGGRLMARLDAQFRGAYFLREFNTPTDRQAAHTIVNANLSYGFTHTGLTLRGFVKNVTDEPVLGGLLGVAGYKAATFNLPRTWGLGLDYAFDS